ncbi:gas vesicle protein GvpN [Halobacillus yeomjeoni]|uniref:gas vesicle protein GvpN n=1 Tax=Halobacillus yeomjeoni TaxID=311194 RepID=UPI001CD552B4|nr:gas vesicle protein GvpN [Halobacillus yeomjeoni]MCA0984728.1 gas vesicle protein GvpN [Halobacillus yeomjeoni]
MSRLTRMKQKASNQQDVYDHPFFRSLIRRSHRYLSAGYPIHYTGPSGIGKTTLAVHVAKSRNRPVTLINGNRDMSNEDLIGAFKGYNRKKLNDNFVKQVHKVEENVTEDWVEGRLYEAVKNGHTVVYDEFTRSSPDTNNLFLSVIEEKILPLYGAKRKQSHIEVHPHFSIIFTSNPSEYVGVYETQDALLDRMISLPFETMGNETRAEILMQQTSIGKGEAGKIVDLIGNVNALCREGSQTVSLRASLMMADVIMKNDIPVDGENEEFQQLALDVCYFHLKLCSKREEDVRSHILNVCKQV